MRTARLILFISAVFLMLQLPVSAKNPLYIRGEVVYHQNFSVLTNPALSGIRKGTAGSSHSEFSCRDNCFVIETYDDGRVYALLPDTDWTTDFTIEFDFSFVGDSNPNGYLAVVLTSSGDEPTNISQLIIRMKGTIDEFETPSEEIKNSIFSGERVNVKIPVENGVVKNLFLSVNGITEELQRTSLLLIGSGNRGFSVRNADVAISEIYIVNGTDYSKKVGVWAESSYASNGMTPPPSVDPNENGTETAPETVDHLPILLLSAVVVGSFTAAKRLKKHQI